MSDLVALLAVAAPEPRPPRAPRWLRRPLRAPAPAVTAALMAMAAGLGDVLRAFAGVLAIAVPIRAAGLPAGDRPEAAPPEAPIPQAPIPDAPPAEAAPPPPLARLPLDRRGARVALAVQDHYVEAATARRALLPVRLADAMRGTGGVMGLQHRPHRVALGHVRAARRQGDGAVPTSATGAPPPVGRSRLRAVRAAGLVPGLGP